MARSTFAQVPDEVLSDPTLTPTAVRVYALLDYRARKRGWFYDSQEDLAASIGISSRTFRRAVAALHARGLVDTTRRTDDRAVTTYRVIARMSASPELGA